MPIEFLDLLDGGGWEPLSPDPASTGATWSEGGTLAEAPVDVAATFEGSAWRATGIDDSFGLTGVRLAPELRVPLHHHGRALLVIVIGGSLTVDGAEDGEGVEADRASLEPCRFCVIEEGTPHSLTAGPQGAVFLTSWPQETEEPTTCWYPDPAWVRAEGRATA